MEEYYTYQLVINLKRHQTIWTQAVPTTFLLRIGFWGSPMIRIDGTNSENVCLKYWMPIVTTRSRHYNLPVGSIRREFVTLLSDSLLRLLLLLEELDLEYLQ